MSNKYLEVCNLCVEIDGKKVLDDINLKFDLGEVNVFLGPNGAGKSTLINVLMGNPVYNIVSGKIVLNGEDITLLSSDERAKKGLFMSFQNPVEVEGVSMLSFLRSSYNAVKGIDLSVSDFLKLLNESMEFLGVDSKFKSRFLNCGFSGGEKKKAEILQFLLLEPDFAFFDEIDSGLDVDALKVVCDGINKIRKKKEVGLVIVTHYNKILDYIKPDKVIVLRNGKIVESGGLEIVKKVEREGFN